MLVLTNVIIIMYLTMLFKKKYPVSLSMYWIVIFYSIYIFVPTFRNHISILNEIPDIIVNKIALYSLIGILSFIITNQFFILKWNKIVSKPQSVITFKATKQILLMFIIFSTLLFILSVGISGITSIFSLGSRNLWINSENKNNFFVLNQLLLFYISILGSVLVLSANTIQQRYKAIKSFFIIIIVISILVFGRRYVVYPLLAVLFYWLSHKKNKTKIIFFAFMIIPLFFAIMFIMGYFRTFGISNFKMGSIIDYFKYTNFMDIFISNTDFTYSYYYLCKQVYIGNIQASVLGYLKAFFILIPRSIWTNKPAYTSVEILSIIEPFKVSQGFSAATGYIGEAIATMGISGLIIISAIWGTVCGYMDKRYYDIMSDKSFKSKERSISGEFTIFEFMYLYTGILLITESHRGDFGAASIHFILEIVLLGLILKVFSKKRQNNRDDISCEVSKIYIK